MTAIAGAAARPAPWRRLAGAALLLGLLAAAGVLAEDPAQPPRPGPARPLQSSSPFTTSVAAVAVASPTQPLEIPSIGVDEIERGQRGYGLSAFSGTELERFEVEVLGVLRNLSPDTSFVLARLSGQGLEESGVVQGMSGSPVYLDGRLAGAVAFGWSFSQDAIAVITPIASMRRLGAAGPPPGTISEEPAVAPPVRPDAAFLGLASPGAGSPRPSPPGVRSPRPSPPGVRSPVSLADLAGLDLPPRLLEEQLALLRPAPLDGARSALMWGAAGFGGEAGALLRQGLGAVGMGGRMGVGSAGEAEEAPDLRPGSPVGAVLVDGDLRLAAVGTVTDRTEDRILAFGHPFLGYGPVRLPMATAEVITVVSRLDTSLKVTNLGPVVGAIDQDRQAGLHGRVGLEAPTIPLVVRVRGGDEREYRMRLADIPQVTPVLLASAVLGGLETAAYRAGSQGLDLRASFLLEDHGVLTLEQSFDGASAGVESATYLLAAAAYLLLNDLEEVRLTGVAVDIEQVPSPRTASLVGAHAERTVVRPGEEVGLNVDLVAYRGAPFRHSLVLTVPEDLPAGRYSLLVGDGPSVDAARLAVESVQPVAFHQALKLLRSFHSRRELVVLGVFADHGLSVAGQPMPRLPGSVRSLWGAAPTGGAVPLKLAVAQERSERLEVPLAGIVRVDLEVRHREPQPPPGEAPAEEGRAGEGEEAGEGGETGEGERGEGQGEGGRAASPARRGDGGAREEGR